MPPAGGSSRPDTDADTGPAPTRRIGRRAAVRWTLLAILAGFAGWAVAGHWAGLSSAVRDLAPWAVPLAFLPAALASLVGLLVWRTLLADLGHRLPGRVAARIFFISQLGKYVPGSVWSILAQMELGRDHQVPRRSNLATGVLAIALSVATGLSLAAVLLAVAEPAAAGRYWWVLPVIAVLLVSLHPAVLARGLRLGLRVTGRGPVPASPSAGGLGRAATLQTLVWLLLGLQAWILLVGSGAPPGHALPVAIGGYALAHGLGQLAVGLPAGAGVREAALTLVLATVVPTGTALAIALLCRGMLTVVDLCLAGGQLLAAARRPTPAGSGRPAGT